MNNLEAFFYAILYGYVILGFFYLLRIEFRGTLHSDLQINKTSIGLIEIGIRDKITVNLDELLSSQEIYQMER